MGADCKLCGCSGWLFWTSPDGLCRNCSHLAGSEMRQRAQIADTAAQEAASTLNPQSKIAKLDIAVSELRVLADYENKGFKTPVEAARLRLDRTTAERDALILKTAREEAAQTLESLGTVPDLRGKIKRLEVFRIKLSEYRQRCGDSRSIEILDRRVTTASYRIRLSNRLDEAASAQSDKHPEDAKRLYQEALEIMEKEGRSDPSFKSQHKQILKLLNTV